MSCQLVDDCLYEIFEYYKEDKNSLHSYSLVNHNWCNVSIRILWSNIWNYKVNNQRKVESSILSTLIACLPNESKELLHKHKIFILPPTSKSPLFNYPEFCKVLSINNIHKIVDNIFEYKQVINNTFKNKPNNFNRKLIVINEVIKMISKQTSFRKMIYNSNTINPNFNFTYYSGVKDLLELHCSTNLSSGFFYKLSQICHNLELISIKFYDNYISDELKELIIMQNNLKSLTLIAFNISSWENIIPALKKHSNTITKLHLFTIDSCDYPLSFVTSFSNLQEIIFSLECFEDFTILQYAKFPKLKVLKFSKKCPNYEYIENFLKNNGKNLEKFYAKKFKIDEILSSPINRFCPNLKSLNVDIRKFTTLETIFANCQYLESISITFEPYNLFRNMTLLEIIVKYSPYNFCELRIYHHTDFKFLNSEEFKSFLMKWKNRIPKKLLSLIIIKNDDDVDFEDFCDKNMKMIKKYESLGIIKFEIKNYKDDEKEESNYYYY